jgi:hypothetical protein
MIKNECERRKCCSKREKEEVQPTQGQEDNVSWLSPTLALEVRKKDNSQSAYQLSKKGRNQNSFFARHTIFGQNFEEVATVLKLFLTFLPITTRLGRMKCFLGKFGV